MSSSKKYTTNKNTPKQLSLFDDKTLDVLDNIDSRVRHVVIEGEHWFSALDLLQYHGNKKNPTQSWRVTLEYMKKQGANLGSTFCVEHQFEGKGQRKTPIINLEGFLRFAQSAEVPEWEFIREFQVQAGAKEIKSKALRKLELEIAKHDKAGLGDRPEIVMLKARLDNKVGHIQLTDLVAILCEKPNFGRMNNEIYMALFGMVAEEIKKLFDSKKSVPDSLPLRQLQFLTISEGILADAVAMQNTITMQQISEIVDIAIVPMGKHLKWVSDTFGRHHITGKPLLNSGK